MPNAANEKSMSENSVVHEDHFKLLIPFKEKILFESQLIENGIQYHCPEPQSGVDYIYYLPTKNQKEIDRIIIENEIIAGTETINVSDYRDQSKAQKIYILIAIAIIIIVIIASEFLKK